jgi:hypothetical protein
MFGMAPSLLGRAGLSIVDGSRRGASVSPLTELQN